MNYIDEEYFNEIEEYLKSIQFEIYEHFKLGTLYKTNNGGIFMEGLGFWPAIRIITDKHFNNSELYTTKLRNKEFNLGLIIFKYKDIIINTSQIEITENK